MPGTRPADLQHRDAVWDFLRAATVDIAYAETGITTLFGAFLAFRETRGLPLNVPKGTVSRLTAAAGYPYIHRGHGRRVFVGLALRHRAG